MGVDTDGKISKLYGVKYIQRALKHKLNVESRIENTGIENYYQLIFTYKDENRMMSVFENYKDDETKEIGTHMSFSMWGHSVEIMRSIIEMFGGFIKENDCNDDWEYISPTDKIILTDDEILEDKLLSKLKESELNFTEQQRIVRYIKDNLDFIKSL